VIVDIVYAHPGFEGKADGHVVVDAGPNSQRGVGHAGQRFLGGQYLERPRVKHAALHGELREQGWAGSAQTVRRYVRPFRPPAGRRIR